ncbi:MAG: hypothetical protein IKN24_03810 [Lachnospiraceae bacterium]|nr:hypothetical protein [Lachnospiraceae bacterium]
MICLKCGALLTKQDVCLKCGTDVVLYKKIMATSDHMYNEALYLAKKRDLTGAKNYLRQSLMLNKKNIDARNLLGLVYYELGEPSYAVREWAISISYKESGNIASRYLAEAEKNLHALKVSVSKYNQAVAYMKSGSVDMAQIALKQVVSRPYCMIKAKELLALIFIKSGSLSKAKKLLEACAKQDTGDMLCRRYLEEIAERKRVGHDGSYIEAMAQVFEAGRENSDVIIPENTREYNSYFMNLLYVIIGLILGAGILYYIVIPGERSRYQQENTDNLISMQDSLSTRDSELASVRAANERLTAQIAELMEQPHGSTDVNDTNIYDDFLPVLNAYIKNDVVEIIDAISALDRDQEDAQYRNLYNRLINDYKVNMGYRAFYRGSEFIDKGAYYDALDQYKLAYQLLGESARTVYYVGYAYEMVADLQNALYYYEYANKTYPDDVWVGHSQSGISRILGNFPELSVPDVTPGELNVVGLVDLWTPDEN